MAPKKKLQQKKDHAKPPSKSKGHPADSKNAPKLQISAENERRIRRLLLNTERLPSDASTPATLAGGNAVASHSQKAKRLRSVYDKLSLEGFTPDQIEQALSVLNEGATLESALDWLCLNIPGHELPLKFSSGAVPSIGVGDRSIRIISTAREDWVPAECSTVELEEGAFGASYQVKGKKDEFSLDCGKSSQVEWIRQYLEQQDQKEEEEEKQKEVCEVDPSSHAFSITEEYRHARLEALLAKQRGDHASQKHFGEIIFKLKKEFALLGLSEDVLESELQGEISNLKMQDMPSNSLQFISSLTKPQDDAKLKSKNAIVYIDDSASSEEIGHAIPISEECEKNDVEELELDNLFLEDPSFGRAPPPEFLGNQKKEKPLQPAYLYTLGSIDDLWKKGDPQRFPKAVLQKVCQRLRWEAPKYNRLSAKVNKFLYAVSILRAASGHGRSRKSGGLITFNLPGQDEALRSSEEAQNAIAAFALCQLFPDFPFDKLLLEPYASMIIKWLQEDDFSTRIEDAEDSRRAGFVHSLLSVGGSQTTTSINNKDESLHWEMTVDHDLDNDIECCSTLGNAKMLSFDGLSPQEQVESNLLIDELENKLKNPKYMSMLESRASLPIAKLKDNILQTLNECDVIVVSGETGSDQDWVLIVMSYAHNQEELRVLVAKCRMPSSFLSLHGLVMLSYGLEPRAISVAERVSDERCESYPGTEGSLVGYHVRLDAARNKRTKLLFCTTGVLLRKLAGDKDLAGVTHVIVDEVHERSLLGDFLLTILKNIIKRQSLCNRSRSKLKVILMSATVDSNLFSRYFGNSPIIKVEGRTHPVSVVYLEDIYEKLEYRIPLDSMVSGAFLNNNRGRKLAKSFVDKRKAKRDLVISSWGDDTLLSEGYVNPHYVHDRYQSYNERTQLNLKSLNEEIIDFDLLEDLIHHIHETFPPGAILVFLPGVAEIDLLVDKLTASFRFRGQSSDWVLPLHSMLASTDQHKVFLTPPENIRKVIISTDIAETSITINDVIYVVDTGKHKESHFNPQKGFKNRLFVKVPLSVGQVPEMLRMALTDLCLQIKSLALGDIKSFLMEAIEPPGEEAIGSAIDLLYKVGAFEGCEELSPLGRHLAKLPVDVLVGKMMLYGAIFCCLSPVLSIAAFMSHKSPFIYPKDEKHNVMRAKLTMLAYDLDGGNVSGENSRQSDHLLLVIAYNRWARILRENGSNAAYRFCHSFYLNSSVMYTVREMRLQLGSLLADIGLIGLPNSFQGNGKRNDKLESWFSDMRRPFNMHAKHSSVIKSILCAGLYPNVAASVEGIIGVPMSSQKGLSTGVSANNHSVWFDGKREANVLTLLRWKFSYLGKPLLDLLKSREKHNSKYFKGKGGLKLARYFYVDISIVSPYSLLLFGGSIQVQHQTGLVIIDNWLKLTAPAQTAVLFKELRLTLNSVLKELIRTPKFRLKYINMEKVGSTIMSKEDDIMEIAIRRI
ncbi:hypothetical protein HPP92_005388 [Vanilla planifolia]|uniref:DExH-box ATP-dependent RNA helicase DExH7, chloroplastic n=1 Tax=Vanilla planifolia TaxID=51239 RepID=A0A835VBB0_VANPL|nr:hypothetical protein HPP92_005388 [Vanilla planifolia]